MTKDQTSSSEQLAQALLLEQVRYYQQQLSADHSPEYIQHICHLIFQSTQYLNLNQVHNAVQRLEVVQGLPLEMQLGADLLEFIGEVSKQIFISALKSSSTLNDLISDHQFEIWLSKFLELEHVRVYLNNFLRDSPAIQQLCHFIATTVIQKKLPGFLQNPNFQEHHTQHPHSSWQQRIKRFSLKQQQRIEQKLEDYLATFIQEQLAELTILSNDDLEDLIRNIWDDLKEKTVYQYISKIDPLDVEEFFVLIYEYWKELRQQPFMQNLILRGVEVFYRFYEHETLQDLLYGIGLNESDIKTEALRFYPKVLRAFEQQNLLEPLLMQILKPFYIRPATLALIEQHQN